ncbi:MAG: FHA domain-containing protein [bacterium]|nr:FHA domain-containing protein [bacterium]
MDEATFRITVKSGIAKGTSWIIPDRGLSVGRDEGCDVTLADSLVSRYHCRLTAKPDGVFLEDLGSSNATLVNGASVDSVLAEPGDEIAVGRTIFVVGTGAVQKPGPQVPPPFATTMSLSENESVYLSEEVRSEAEAGHGFSVADIVCLFQCAHRMGQADSTDTLIETLCGAVTQRLRPESCWLVRSQPDGRELKVQCAGGKGSPDNFPESVLRQAVDEGRGVLVLTRDRRGERHETLVTMAAPLRVSTNVFGAIAARKILSEGGYDESDLQFLVALSGAAAPSLAALEHLASLERENARLRASGAALPTLVGDSEPMTQLTQVMRQLASSDQPVLIAGETGSGKDVVANLIHAWSPRADGPFVPVNCAAIPKELFESEVFGHERGAFTGASARKTGLLEQSDGGTLFLDEVGDLSLEHQARILRAIETKQFRPVGAERERSADFRVLAATNRDSEQQMRDGTLREDLYHRLRVLSLYVPPLRDHVDDVPALAAHFLERACAREGLRPTRTLSPDAMALLQTHTWPGNVRELRACIEAAVVFAEGASVTADDLARVLRTEGGKSQPSTLAEAEKRLIEDALEFCGGNVVEAAKVLGVGKDRLYRRLSEYKREG